MGNVELFRKEWTIGTPKAAIVLVHGQGEHSGRYGYAAAALNRRGYDVYSGDLPGHGRSGGLRGHIDRFDDYLRVVDEWLTAARRRQSGAPVFLLGHSVGGLIAIRYLETQPNAASLAGAVLSSPALRLRYPIAPWKTAIGRRLDRLFPLLRMSSGLEGQRATRNEEVRAVSAQDPLMVRVASVRFYNELIRAQQAALQAADRITLPLLLLHGGADEIIEPAASLEFGQRLALPDQEVRLLPGLHHEIMNEPERDDVLREIADWLDKHI